MKAIRCREWGAPDVLRHMAFRSLIGPRVSPVTAAEILLANSLRGSSQFQSRIKGKTNRRPQSSTMHRLMPEH